MSGSAVISPNTIDTTILEDSQPPGSIVPGAVRQMNDSLASLPTNGTQTTNYTYVAADFGCLQRYNSTSAGTFTIPANVFKTGNVVFFRSINTGQLTIAAGSGFTLTIPAALTATPAQNATGAIHFDSPTAGTMM
jgi:hypothetical protein